MPAFDEKALSCNAFLGGKVMLQQPKAGYRAGIDPVLLAAAVSARAGQSVLELGCGAGQAFLCLSARVPDLCCTGVELLEEYAELARRNARANGAEATVITADLSALPMDLRQRQFDHVIANPPYYRAGAHVQSQDAGRRAALGEDTPLDVWVSIAAKRLRPKGYLTMIQRADRLPDLLAACSGRVGSVEILPLAPRQGRAAELVILKARKNGRADFRLYAPQILHAAERHLRDGDDYRPEISAVLKTGAALPWPR